MILVHAQNGCLSLRKLGKLVKVQNLPYPFLRGQPLKIRFVSNMSFRKANCCGKLTQPLYVVSVAAVIIQPLKIDI